MMEIYITCLQQILSFSSRCRRFEMENSFRRPIMVGDNISYLVAPPSQRSFISTGLYLYVLFSLFMFSFSPYFSYFSRRITACPQHC